MENVTLEYLFTNKFEKTGLEVEAKKNTSGMFTKAELGMLPRSDSEKLYDLKIMMGDYIYEKGGYKNVYVKTNINPDSLKKTIGLTQNRGIKREMLAKFVVGYQLSLEQANELFELHSYALNPKTTLLDAVVVHCIQNGYDICDFFDVCEQVKLDITVVS